MTGMHGCAHSFRMMKVDIECYVSHELFFFWEGQMTKRFICAILAMLVLCSGGIYSHTESDHGFEACVYSFPRGGDYSSRLVDDDVMTRFSFKEGQEISIAFEQIQSPYLFIEWYELTESYTLIQEDANNGVISDVKLTPKEYVEAIELSGETRTVRIVASERTIISTLEIYSEYPTNDLLFTPSSTVADVVLVISEPCELFESFSALIPYLKNEYGVTIAVICCNDQRRDQVRDVMESLISLGISEKPIFLHLNDSEYNLYDDVASKWDEARTQQSLLDAITALSAKVVLFSEGDTDRARKQFLYEQMTALSLNSQLAQKVYCVGSSGSLTVDCSEYLDEAESAYAFMDSRMVFRYKLPNMVKLNLVTSAVGNDSGAGLLENIDISSLISYVSPTPVCTPSIVPSEEPISEPIESIAPIPQSTPAATAAPKAVNEQSPNKDDNLSLLSWVAGGFILLVGLLLFLLLKKTPMAIRVIILAICVVLAFAWIVFCLVTKGKAPAADDVMAYTTSTAETTIPLAPSPTAVSTDAPALEPTAESTVLPTADPYSEQPFYLGADEETIESDDQNGSWAYRNRDFAVEIKRYNTTVTRGRTEDPLVYFIAHIYMRSYDSFRAGFGSYRHNGVDICPPVVMAQRYKAVLWITGDNLINAEREDKGILIRDGYLFSRNRAEDTMALYDDLTMRIYGKSDISADDLFESGTQNSFSFGPTLVLDGKIAASASSITMLNPRCGLGQVEPGHFVAIVADGRQAGYSMGLNLVDFAQLFIDEGCTMAYNLDGGVSTSMVFMGKMLNQVSNDKDAQSWTRSLPEGLMWGYSEQCAVDALIED